MNVKWRNQAKRVHKGVNIDVSYHMKRGECNFLRGKTSGPNYRPKPHFLVPSGGVFPAVCRRPKGRRLYRGQGECDEQRRGQLASQHSFSQRANNFNAVSLVPRR